METRRRLPAWTGRYERPSPQAARGHLSMLGPTNGTEVARTSTTGIIAAEYDVRLIRTENQGLSAARNLGWQSATGEIVAYIDDDASPDPDWLTYLAAAFLKEEYAGVGGPNIPVPDDGDTANCIA